MSQLREDWRLFREWIGGLIAPETAKKAMMHDWLVSEIAYEARWLSEFPYLSRTLDRLLALKAAHFRPLDTESALREDYDISRYRDALRGKETARKCPRYSSVFILDCAAIYGGAKCERCGKWFT